MKGFRGAEVRICSLSMADEGRSGGGTSKLVPGHCGLSTAIQGGGEE